MIRQPRLIQLFRAIEPLVKKPRFLDRTALRFYPIFVPGARAEIADNVHEAEAVCLHENCRARLFSYLDLGRCVLCEMLFDQIQVLTPAVEPENRHLTTPFHYCSALLSQNQGNAFLYKLFLTTEPMCFPRLSNSSMNFRISSFGFVSQICMGSRSSVSPILIEIGTCTFL